MLGLSFGFCEIALRVFNAVSPSFIFYSGDYDRNRAQAGSKFYGFEVNSQGFLDVEFGEKKEGVKRVLALGDSFAFGVVPYEGNFLTLAEEILNAEGQRIEILNMGIPSTRPEDYLALLLAEGLALEPDAVRVSFFMGNDLTPSRRAWVDYAHVGSLLMHFVGSFKQEQGQVYFGDGKYCDDCPSFDEETYLEIEADRSRLFLGEERLKRSMEATALYIEEMKDICEGLDIELSVALCPDEFQVDEALRRRVRDVHFPGLPLEAWDVEKPNQELVRALERMGIEVLDLLELFQAGEERLYKKNDSHWNLAGNRLAGEAVAKFISSE